MVIKIRKKALILIICCVTLFGIICYFGLSDLISLLTKPSNKIIAGGMLHSSFHNLDEYIPVINQDSINSERFQRPSKELPYPNPYTF